MGQLWDQLQTRETLTRGWHLARSDVRQDFSQDLYSTDVYGHDLKENIRETINRIRTDTYQVSPLFRIEVPKGTLSFRPGAVIPIQDRVVLSAITLLLAPHIDKQLPESVFSWRLKDPLPKRGPIFREGDITDLPFLRKRTIRIRVDPFEAWYRLWPEFDERTRELFRKEGYRFLATSDIAAYFENIQLPILRDQLLKHVHGEPEIVNLLIHFLETWAERTGDGRAHFRGIPQGNFISSFLGNFFLLPLDESLVEFCAARNAIYYRYMDDVRVFTKGRDDARVAVLRMARRLRELHLNVQTAKTRIYDESRKEVSSFLIDARVDALNEMIGDLEKKYKHKAPPIDERQVILDNLSGVAKTATPSGQKIKGTRNALEGLSLRCFGRWTYAHMLAGSHAYANRLLTEISKSADDKLTRKLVSTTKRFPQKRGIQNQILAMIRNGQIIFPYQEAECLRAIRYLSTITHEIREHAWGRLVDEEKERYLRMQSAYLLSRELIEIPELDSLQELFEGESDPYVQTAIATILVQRRKDNQDIVQSLYFHPNEKIRNIGKFFRSVKNESEMAKKTLRNALKPQTAWVLCDYMPLIHLMGTSENPAIRMLLIDAIRTPRNEHPIGGLRAQLRGIFTRTRESLKTC